MASMLGGMDNLPLCTGGTGPHPSVVTQLWGSGAMDRPCGFSRGVCVLVGRWEWRGPGLVGTGLDQKPEG